MEICIKNISNQEIRMKQGDGLSIDLASIAYFAIIFLSIFSLLGNGVILTTILTCSKFRRPSNYLIGNLSLASALCSISVIFRCMEHRHGFWKYGPLTCFTLGTLHRVPHNTEAFTMMQLIVDRARLSGLPHRRETSLVAGRKTLVIWISSILIDVPRGIYHEYNGAMKSNYKCMKGILLNHKGVHLAYFGIHLSLTLIIPILFLLRECCILNSKLNYLYLSMKQDPNTPSIYKRVHILKGALVLTGMFLVFYIPQCCIQVAFELPKEMWPDGVHQYIFIGRKAYYTLITIHSNCYPILIFIISSELRKKLFW